MMWFKNWPFVSYEVITWYFFCVLNVQGAGHLAAEYQPKEVASLIDRFMAYYPL